MLFVGVSENKLLEKHNKNNEEKHSSLTDTKKIITDRYFIMYSVSAFVVKHVFHVPHLIIPMMMSSYGFTPTMQATVFTASGICSK